MPAPYKDEMKGSWWTNATLAFNKKCKNSAIFIYITWNIKVKCVAIQVLHSKYISTCSFPASKDFTIFWDLGTTTFCKTLKGWIVLTTCSIANHGQHLN